MGNSRSVQSCSAAPALRCNQDETAMARGNLSLGPVVRESVRHPYVAGNADNRSEDGDSQGVAPRPRRQMPAANRTGTMDANKSALSDGFVDFHRIKRTFVDVTITDAGHAGARVVCPRSWPILTELGRPGRSEIVEFNSTRFIRLIGAAIGELGEARQRKLPRATLPRARADDFRGGRAWPAGSFLAR
jgi:hypothetical protein